MGNEQRKIRMHRIVLASVFAINLIAVVICACFAFKSDLNVAALVSFCIFISIDIFFFAFFISSLFLSCKYYVYEGRDIIVYAGFYHHYMTVDGRRVDEHNTITSFTPIILSCTLPEGTHLFATVSLTNRISLKINDMLYTVVK